VKAVLFLARRFAFEPFAAALPDVTPPAEALPRIDGTDDPNNSSLARHEFAEAVVAFIHCEERDAEKRSSVFSRTLKQIKWLAGKRAFRRVVLHSFTHLSSSKAAPDFAEAFLDELAGRLRRTGYEVALTPFGYTCTWDLEVYGETLAKVYVEF
jgi:hypothetical protein